MAHLSAAILNFNDIRDKLLTSLDLDSRKKIVALNHLAQLKDIVVQAELDNALLQGKISTYRELLDSREGAKQISSVVTLPTPDNPSHSSFTPPEITGTQLLAQVIAGDSEELHPTSPSPTPQEGSLRGLDSETLETTRFPEARATSVQAAHKPQVQEQRLTSRSAREPKAPPGTYSEAAGSSNRRGKRPRSSRRQRERSKSDRTREASSKKTRSSSRTVNFTSNPPQVDKLSVTTHPKQGASGTVIIRPTSRGRSGQDLRKQLEDCIKPKDLGFPIRSIFTGNDQLVVQVSTKEQADTLLRHIDGKKLRDISAKRPAPRSVPFIIFSIPNSVEEEDILSGLRALLAQQQRVNIRVRTSIRGKKDTSHWVIDAPHQTTTTFLKKGRICIGFTSCRIKPYFQLQRCFRCQRLGHSSFSCRSPQLCADCGSSHEPNSTCQSPLFCINCASYNSSTGTTWQTNHSARAGNCKTYLLALSLAKEGKKWQNPKQIHVSNTAQQLNQGTSNPVLPAMTGGRNPNLPATMEDNIVTTSKTRHSPLKSPQRNSGCSSSTTAPTLPFLEQDVLKDYRSSRSPSPSSSVELAPEDAVLKIPKKRVPLLSRTPPPSQDLVQAQGSNAKQVEVFTTIICSPTAAGHLQTSPFPSPPPLEPIQVIQETQWENLGTDCTSSPPPISGTRRYTTRSRSQVRQTKYIPITENPMTPVRES